MGLPHQLDIPIRAVPLANSNTAPQAACSAACCDGSSSTTIIALVCVTTIAHVLRGPRQARQPKPNSPYLCCGGVTGVDGLAVLDERQGEDAAITLQGKSSTGSETSSCRRARDQDTSRADTLHRKAGKRDREESKRDRGGQRQVRIGGRKQRERGCLCQPLCTCAHVCVVLCCVSMRGRGGVPRTIEASSHREGLSKSVKVDPEGCWC